MYQGLSGHSIAYNEHGIAPRATALGMRPGAVAERARNARFDKRERARRRALEAVGHYARATHAAPPRERTLLRALRRDITKAMRRGEARLFERLAKRYEALMTARVQRLQAAAR